MAIKPSTIPRMKYKGKVEGTKDPIQFPNMGENPITDPKIVYPTADATSDGSITSVSKSFLYIIFLQQEALL